MGHPHTGHRRSPLGRGGGALIRIPRRSPDPPNPTPSAPGPPPTTARCFYRVGAALALLLPLRPGGLRVRRPPAAAAAPGAAPFLPAGPCKENLLSLFISAKARQRGLPR